MTGIRTLTLEVSDPTAAEAFYNTFGVSDVVHVRAATTESTGFRGFALSLVVSQPGTVDEFVNAAVRGGATAVKPATMGFWGYGGVVQAPDGALWKVATSAKKNTGPSVRHIDSIVLLLGVDNVKASKRFYLDRGMPVRRSFGSKYVEFEAPEGAVTLALYTRPAAAKDLGVAPAGSGSHRILIGADAGPFTDPDGFSWELAPVTAGSPQ